jgi:hypothetical protein
MKKVVRLVFCSMAIAMTGCAVKNDRTAIGTGSLGLGREYHSNIEHQPNGTYVASVETSLFAGRIAGAQEAAMRNANEHCKLTNKKVKVVDEATDSHFLLNGVARLNFRCE